MDNQKIALLDTDFTVKTIMSQKDSEHHLIDLLILDCNWQSHSLFSHFTRMLFGSI